MSTDIRFDWSSGSDTWFITGCRPEHDGHGEYLDQPCYLAEMTHFGERGTGFVECRTHGTAAGYISYARNGPSMTDFGVLRTPQPNQPEETQ